LSGLLKSRGFSLKLQGADIELIMVLVNKKAWIGIDVPAQVALDDRRSSERASKTVVVIRRANANRSAASYRLR
jgi:hypothetical protein